MLDLEVKINSMYPPGASGGIRAYASVTVDGCSYQDYLPEDKKGVLLAYR